MSEAIDPDLPLYFKTRITPHSRVKVVEIDYRADPGKRSPEWEAETRRKLITDRAWRREMGRDWTLGEGDSFYPEFELFGGRKVYVRKIPGLINGPVYRGWDFGFRKPACCWFQYSAKSDTVYVLREWSPEDISTHTMADIVKYLSGQLDMERLTPDGMKWLERIHADKTFPPTPWFPRLARPIQFLDFAGPEVTKISPQVEADKKEKTDYQILQSKGINIQWDSVSPSAREEVIRRLLRLRRCSIEAHKVQSGPGCKGHPGMYLDPACYTLIRGLSGGITYPEPTKMKPTPTDPQKDKFFEHIHDAFGYGVTQIVPAADPEELQANDQQYDGQFIYQGRIPIPLREVMAEPETMDFYETRIGRM